MSQSLSQIWVHIIFSTKSRYPFLTETTTQQQVHEYIKTTCHKLQCKTLIVGGVADHVHVLTNLHKNISLSQLVEKIKTTSSKWIKTLDVSNDLLKFYWQNGYGAFSVSQSNLEAVRLYIENQYKHHQKLSFQDEFRKFLVQYGVTYDEKYVWD